MTEYVNGVEQVKINRSLNKHRNQKCSYCSSRNVKCIAFDLFGLNHYACFNCEKYFSVEFITYKKIERKPAMYVYLRSEPGLWTVGFYAPDGSWHSESDHDNREDAARRVAWLNGSK